MRFASPQILWLLLVLPPALVAFLWWAWRRKQELLSRFIEPRLLASLTAGVSPARRKLRLAFLVAAVVWLVFTWARLQWGFDWEETKQRGLDIVVAIDVSKSMLADDIAPNRLTRAKLAALDLMQQAKADRLGLVTFAGVAFLQCPLTVDDAAFRQSVELLDVNTIPQGGTAIAEAIETAQTAFKEQDNEKALVLFTDGEDHDSHALEAAEKAAQAGMRIFTIGIGTPEGELLRAKDAQGRTDFVRDEDGNVVKSHLNEKLLEEIAKKTGAFYLPLRGADTMDKLYAGGLSKLTKTESPARLVKQYHERFYWPLLLAILCLFAEMVFPERNREARQGRIVGKAGRAVLRPGAPDNATGPVKATSPTVTAAAVVLLLAALPMVARASPAQAMRAYRAGRYDEALKDYQRSLERKADDPRLHFNAGAAAYRGGQFEEATKQFGQALAAPDLKLQQDAYYNLGNTLFQIGERAAEPDKKTEAWEQAVKGYESTLKLDPKDADARFNHDFVKKLLEELKKRPQQQQNQKDQKDQSQQQKDSQQNQQQKQPDQAQQNQPQKDQQRQQPQQNQPQPKQQDQQSQAKNQKDQQKKDQAQAAQAQQAKDQQSKAGDQSEATPASAGQMTPQQARQLLDAAKAQEAMLPLDVQKKPTDTTRRFKDW